ncbi:MAG: A/G-specific adenine glycosylase [Candidatus Cloacimonadota bacterium]|nr:MAG: A/G-specific adenine glycosylase [Candidatus Cloacimonadota bacterium]
MSKVIQLYQWYMHNQRDLPWRKNKDPYKILVSEIMLQQTRVEAVIIKYNAFIKKFPDLKSLAQAQEDSVLKAWEGLGYYRRARNLKKTCELIYYEYSNKFPRYYVNLLKFPGIGEYTASAVASIAFGENVAVLDGNVIRIISRIFMLDGDPKKSDIRKKFMKCIIDDFFYEKDSGNYNQAMMELGALICTPKSPKCHLCPVNDSCISKKENKIDEYPQILKPVKKVKVFLYFYLDVIDKKIQLTSNNWKSYQKGYICPPFFESETLLNDEQIKKIMKINENSLKIVFKHNITKYNIECIVYAKSKSVIEFYEKCEQAKSGFLLKALSKFKQ